MEVEIIQLNCSQCGKPIEASWFARISEGENWEYFCCPKCVLSHIENDQIIPWDDANFIRNAKMFSALYKG